MYAEFYPDGPRESKDVSRIVSTLHAERLKGLLDATKGTVVLGGEVDTPARYIAPTVVRDVGPGDSLMGECVARSRRVRGHC